ncbi:DUF1206 domain-containing protein [Conyzicola sp.]|uniref:DUF1206 domain-containing protein n=1 Tax=Conyzicola sp. TaxID=1969404 RepID=UPI00398962E0
MSEPTADAVDTVRSGASSLRSSSVFQTLARGGYAVNGLIHILIGGIAISVASGGGGEADQGGALAQVASYPFGEVILWVVVVALAALGLFQLVDAALVRGREKSDWAERGKEAAKGIAYLAVGASALTYAMGGSSDSGNQTQDLSASLLAAPGGVVLLMAIGVITIAVGVYFVVKGVRRTFLEDLALPSARWKRGATVLGVAGYVSKGVAIFVVGVLFIVAAVTADASEATGLDGALKSLVALPAGGVLLIAIGVGLIAYGVYCFVRARFRS